MDEAAASDDLDTLPRMPLLGTCQAQSEEMRTRPLEVKKISLGIVGYNYTNRAINTFSVNGSGGGNLFVSTASSGGGSTTCCVPYFVGVRRMKLDIRWQSGGCSYHVKSSTFDEVYRRIHPIFRETTVEIASPFPEHPKYVEVHFYPDGSIQATLAGAASTPRIRLAEEEVDRSSYPECPDDKQPAQEFVQ